MFEGYEFYQELDASVKEVFTPEEAALIEKAYRYAYEKHKGQKRKSGEEYIIHPVAVAKTLIGFGLDCQSVIAALLHDVVEDTILTKEEIESILTLIENIINDCDVSIIFSAKIAYPFVGSFTNTWVTAPTSLSF